MRTPQPRNALALTVMALLTLTCLALQAAPGRVETTLNGAWETALAPSFEALPTTATWQPFQVPGGVSSIRGERRWFRRTFTVPADWAGQRVFIVYDGVKYASRHWLNGTLVGEHFRGYDRFRIEITSAVRFGAENELLLGCCDWQGTFSAPLDLANVPIGDTAREVPRDVGLTPIGGVFYAYGPWADVALLTVPPVHLAAVTVRTSVRQHELAVAASVANLDDAAQTVQLAGGVVEAPEIALPARPLQVPPGKTVNVTWTVPWPNPKLWDIEQPNLYHLQLTLTAPGQADDRRSTRFGFREFWVDGPRFRLNGTPLLLRSSAMWPLPEPTREAAAGRLRKLQGINAICFRTHTQPWRQHWYDAADEVGMLMIPEAPVFNDDTYYRLADPRFWENYAGELESMVGRVQNNPSVIAYSLENEFFGPLLNDTTPAKAELVKLGELVRRLDPTRPFMYESDGDPGGVADIEGVHYPHELGEAYRYPEDAYWMEQPKAMSYMFLNGATTWRWERRKPLYIGEYLWCPSPSPALYSILCGDDAYRDYALYAQRAIGMAWSLQTRAYRFYRVSGLCPWTCAGGSLDPATDAMAAAQAESMRPLAAFVKEYTTRFYGGQAVRRTLHVINDTLRGGTVHVTWSLTQAGANPQQGSLSCDLQPTGLAVASFEFTPAAVAKVTPAELIVRATLAGVADFEDRLPYRIYPALRLPAPTRPLGLLAGADDPAAPRLAAHGVATIAVPTLAAIPPEVRVLLIGRNALPALAVAGKPILRVGASADPYQGLVRFIAAGGRVLLLAQTEPHVPLGPLRFIARQATLTFPLAPHHAALAGLTPDDLRFWGPGHLVADAQLSRASCGLRSLLVSGAESGIEHTALAEGEVGSGKLVVCGVRLLEALETEPAAGVLLGNLLQYLERWEPTPGVCAAVTGDASLAALLRSLDVDVPIYPSVAAVPPGAVRTLLLGNDSAGAAVQAARARVTAPGGTVWWHDPGTEPFSVWAAEQSPGLRLAPAAGPLRRREGVPFTDGLARADLCWIQETAAGAPGWAQRGLAPEIIASALELGADQPDPARATATLAATAMQITGSEWNRANGGGMILASVGTLTGELEVAAAGPAIIGFRAKGSPCQQAWPQVGVAVNGEDAGVLTVNTPDWGLFGCRATLKAGKALVTLSFLNDGSTPGEDRNVWFSDVYLQPTQAPPTALTAYTTPLALASLNLGASTVLVDTVRWDRPGAHGGPARTWLTSLLLNLGAQARLAYCASVEAEELEFEAVAHNAVQPGVLCLANPGSVWVDVQCGQAGPYLLRVHARGSPALAEWPILVAKLDGNEVGRLSLDSTTVQPCRLPLPLTAGDHRLELRFVNDYCDPGKADRNCFLDRIDIRPQEPGG